MEAGKSLKDQVGFAVEPRRNCPHTKAEWLELLTETFDTQGKSLLEVGCKECGDSSENWVCIPCGGVFCSRYVNAHMSIHNGETKHPIAFSLSDASFWCYECDSYITSMMMNLARNKFSKMKFPDGDDTSEMNRLADAFKKNLKLTDKKEEEVKEVKFTKEDLVNGLRDKKYKKIVFLTGAGISVSAGIPDFRTPGTGLYSQMAKYNLPQPEAVFHIGYFRTNPEPFYLLMKESFKSDVKPVISHKFIKKINEEGMLSKAVTQNIDGL
jgi:NAD-dependent histone deacetylase SIR2